VTASGWVAIIGAVSTGITTVLTTLVILLRRDVQAVHTIVNQQRTDAEAYRTLLSKTLTDAGIAVPADAAVIPPTL
jgi:hypothetical protein